MLPRMPRYQYVAYRFGEMLVSLCSRAINAVFFGGSTYQTTSARAYAEGFDCPKWAKRRDAIDFVFAWQMKLMDRDIPHCQWAYMREVAEARKTLDRAGELL